MSTFTMPVHWYMSAPVHTIPATLDLNALHHRFIKFSVSSFPVIGERDELVGVVSRTDLIHRAFLHRTAEPALPLLVIPDLTVADIMSPAPITVATEDTVAEAADKLVSGRIHRVYVTDKGHLTGVLSARDVMPAIVDLRIDESVGAFMSTPLFVVPADEAISNATAFFETTNVSGVVVLGEAGPQGVFTQSEALECRHLPRRTQVADAMDTDILTVTEDTPMHQAAEAAVTRRARRIVVTDETRVRGMVTALDFVRAAQ